MSLCASLASARFGVEIASGFLLYVWPRDIIRGGGVDWGVWGVNTTQPPYPQVMFTIPIVPLILSLMTVCVYAADITLSTPYINVDWSPVHTPVVRMLQLSQSSNVTLGDLNIFNPGVSIESYSVSLRLELQTSPFSVYTISTDQPMGRLPYHLPVDVTSQRVAETLTLTNSTITPFDIPPGVFRGTLILTPPGGGRRLVYTPYDVNIYGAGSSAISPPVVFSPSVGADTGDVRRRVPFDMKIPLHPTSGVVRIEIRFNSSSTDCTSEYVFPSSHRLTFSISFDAQQQISDMQTSNGCDIGYGRYDMSIRYLTLIGEWSQPAVVSGVVLTPSLSGNFYISDHTRLYTHASPVLVPGTSMLFRGNYSVYMQTDSICVRYHANGAIVCSEFQAIGIPFLPTRACFNEHNGYISVVVYGTSPAQWTGVFALQTSGALKLSYFETLAFRTLFVSIFPFDTLGAGKSIASFRTSRGEIVTIAINVGNFASVYVARETAPVITGQFIGVPRSKFSDGLSTLWVDSIEAYDPDSNLITFHTVSPVHAYVVYDISASQLIYGQRREQLSSCSFVAGEYIYVREVYQKTPGDSFSIMEEFRKEVLATREVVDVTTSGSLGISALIQTSDLYAPCWIRALPTLGRVVVGSDGGKSVSIYDNSLQLDTIIQTSSFEWMDAYEGSGGIVVVSGDTNGVLNKTQVSGTPIIRVGAPQSTGSPLEVLLFERGVGGDLIITLSPQGSTTSFSLLIPIRGYVYSTISELVSSAIALNIHPFQVESIADRGLKLMSASIGDIFSTFVSPSGYQNTSITVSVVVGGETRAQIDSSVVVTASLVNSSSCSGRGSDTLGFCSCDPGFYGPTCGMTKDECSRVYTNDTSRFECGRTVHGEVMIVPSGNSYCVDMCSGRGICIPYQGCVCTNSWYGAACNETNTECSVHTCGPNRGMCAFTTAGVAAECMVLAATPIDCGPHGSLTRIGGSQRFWCSCDDGYYGAWCDLTLDECTKTLCSGTQCTIPSDTGQGCGTHATDIPMWVFYVLVCLCSIMFICGICIFAHR